MREIRVGDRFRDSTYNDVWEYIEPTGDNVFPHKAVCLKESPITDSGVFYPKDTIDTWDFWDEGWEFIGNFSKASNFNNLYDKLNEHRG